MLADFRLCAVGVRWLLFDPISRIHTGSGLVLES